MRGPASAQRAGAQRTMHIAIDISVLRIAQAGVLVYTSRLIEALAAERGGHELTLLDVLPLNPGLPMRPLAAFDAPGVRVVRCAGLRRAYVSAHPLLRHGLPHALAERIAQRWVAKNLAVFRETGKLVEKYNVYAAGGGGGGEYPLQDGFGWTNGVLRRLLTDYPRLAEEASSAD